MRMFTSAGFPLAGAVLLAVATLALALFYRGADADIADTIGYVQAAHQLARGEGLAYRDPHNRIDHRYYTLYAFKVVQADQPHRFLGLLPGVSILAAAAERLTGSPAMAQVITPLAAAGLILMTFALGATLMGAWIGLWASLLLFSASTFLRFSAALWSEVPGSIFLYGGLVLVALALRRAQDDGPARLLGLLGGMLAGVAFFVRFSNVAVIPAILGLIGVLGGKAAYRQRRSLLLVGALGGAFLALLGFNALYYGSPFDTGYSPRHGWYVEPAFSIAYAFGTPYGVPQMGRELLNALGLGLVLAVAGVWVKPRQVGWWLAGTALVLLLPYMFYRFAAEGLNARFVIPALPALCLLAGRTLVALGRRLPSSRARAVLSMLLVIALLLRVPPAAAALAAARQSAQTTIARAQGLAQLTEPDAVLLTYALNDVIAVYGQRSVMTYRHMVPYDQAAGKYLYDQLEPLLVAEVQRLLVAGTSVYYVLDGNPPLYKSDQLLRRHFSLLPVSTDSSLFQVVLPRSSQ